MSIGYSSTIELFSVELWREIFDYLNFRDIRFSFRNLNQKIDAIIDQTMIHLDFISPNNYAYFLKYVVPSMNIMNVRSLKLQDDKRTKLFFTMYPLNSLEQLRSLSLNCMYSLNDKSFQFWYQLSSLKYLQVLKIKFWTTSARENCIDEKEFIIRSIFNNEFCPLLKVFKIHTCGRQRWRSSIPSLVTTTKTTHIQYLSIDSLTFDDLLRLLSALQHVKSFRTGYQLSLNDKQKQEIIFTIPLMPKCIHLYLKLSDEITFEHVEYILKQVPHLKDLFLWGWKHLLDAKRWETLLSIQCSKISKFELTCTGPVCDDDFDDAIDSFQEECAITPFWIERNVIIIDDEDRSGHDYRSDVIIQFNIEKKKQQTEQSNN
ncbi:unnamed protein product [Adineta ricciae]|uniref:F-box domain-containing protein n=1 Tax=Adineta ricciae TaxID=249248 RepID=A0A815JKW2_ADIRI|nr:unnamed protein product [Adineta ricciae]